MAKGDIAHYEQYLLLPQLFQKSSAAEASESIFMWERVKRELFPWKKYFGLYWSTDILSSLQTQSIISPQNSACKWLVCKLFVGLVIHKGYNVISLCNNPFPHADWSLSSRQWKLVAKGIIAHKKQLSCIQQNSS